jgi:squalene-hopene/tetraprenyl-beta-curcumene cyclase
VISRERLEAAYATAKAALLAERTSEGFWIGELATSALSTATAIGALSLLHRQQPDPQLHSLIENGLQWLVRHQNPDGGWGDTDRSHSNISTAMLCRAAFHLAGRAGSHSDVLLKAESYLDGKCGISPLAPVLRGEGLGVRGLNPEVAHPVLHEYRPSPPTPRPGVPGRGGTEYAAAIRARYGTDRTFSVPILTMSALAGLVSWSEVPRLPFELACFPQAWFRFLQLPVVSYALPALIALGQAIEHHRPSWNPFRRLAKKKSLQVLERIQPSGGGFLEATPLTSFVLMSLVSIGQPHHPVVRKGTEFLKQSVRPDGSWPIDSNLSVWVTTLSINALAAVGELDSLDQLDELRSWLLAQQYHERHPYTGADPGGWSWTHLPGGVPDADDTPGALLALAHLEPSAKEYPALTAGLKWLADLQNRDGGWPTFCRGWGKLPFDRSGPDLTAHVLRAIAVWLRRFHEKDFLKVNHPLAQRSIPNGLAYLERTQRPEGSWLPLWFGHQDAPGEENPTYGTCRVLAVYRDLDLMGLAAAQRGLAWLRSAQNADGSWGGAHGVAGSIEETAIAVEILIDLDDDAAWRGVAWLVEAVEAGGLKTPSPIGFYFAKLWYYERLYPIIFAIAALGRARRRFAGGTGLPGVSPIQERALA